MRPVPQLDIETLRVERSAWHVLDVRNPDEWAQGVIPGAALLPARDVLSHLDTIPRNRPIAVICQNGNRSQVVAEILAIHGFSVSNIPGGMSNWLGEKEFPNTHSPVKS